MRIMIEKNIVTPLKLLELLFDNVLVDMIAGYTKLYSHREKTDISFEITNGKICLFSTMLLLSGCHKLLDHKMYWKMTPNTRCVSMSRNMLERILRNLLLCDNEQLDK